MKFVWIFVTALAALEALLDAPSTREVSSAGASVPD